MYSAVASNAGTVRPGLSPELYRIPQNWWWEKRCGRFAPASLGGARGHHKGSQMRGSPMGWMVFMENPNLKWMMLRWVPPFWETPKWETSMVCHIYFITRLDNVNVSNFWCIEMWTQILHWYEMETDTSTCILNHIDIWYTDVEHYQWSMTC